MADTSDRYFDDFGFYSPQPTSRATRRQPSEGFDTGPDIGSAVPAIVLPDQTGELTDVHTRLGSAGAVVVFHRSAYW